MGGDGEHVCVSSGVSVGGRQVQVRAENLPQAPRLFRSPAVGALEVAGDPSVRVHRQSRAQKVIGAEASGEGRHEDFRRGGDNGQGRPPGAPVPPGAQGVGTQEPRRLGLGELARQGLQFDSRHASQEPFDSRRLHPPPVPVRQVPARRRRQGREAPGPVRRARPPGQEGGEAVPHRHGAVEVEGHYADGTGRILRDVLGRQNDRRWGSEAGLGHFRIIVSANVRGEALRQIRLMTTMPQVSGIARQKGPRTCDLGRDQGLSTLRQPGSGRLNATLRE